MVKLGQVRPEQRRESVGCVGEVLSPKSSSPSDLSMPLPPLEIPLHIRKQKLLGPYFSPRDCGEK